MPPLTDFVALLGIDLMLCAVCLRLLSGEHGASLWAKGVTVICFLLLWIPWGAAHLPLLAYIRGISSDLSITLVALAALELCQRGLGLAALARQEKMALYGLVAAGALFLYPLALGWGDWDAYRLGWGSYGMWLALLALSLLFWVRGIRLLPLLVGLSLLGWSAGLMESTNLWDYLVDPWLAMAALFHCVKAGAGLLQARFGRSRPGAEQLSP